ncbi:MAG: DNA mismatch repair endonuclease MutL [Thermoplasmata archaeon]|nr:DNA mismatch repair endonuclease MutL [Thermoplasmata archaeon]
MLQYSSVESRIRILPPELVEKIAAGEVVERPSSVVKELVENSIDAGASKIAIYVKGGGIEEIRVVDNGCGMSKEEAILAFRRHATSKLKDEKDLQRIMTLGFRGEALPSIAAVSKIEMLTRRREDIAGTKLILEGGVIKKVEDVGCPPGTSVLVRDLFYNTPARRKFLKGPRQEFYYISSLIEKYALQYPSIYFKLVNEGRAIINAPSSPLISRIMRIWGKEIASDMVEIREEEKIKISGYISKPFRTRKDKSKIVIFVNGRYVKNKILENSVIEGYGTLLFRDSFPYAVLRIEIDPEEIDVNVHPAKLYIKFKNEEEIKKRISSAIWNTLTGIENIPKVEKSAGEIRENNVTEMKVEAWKIPSFEVETPKREKKIEDYLPQMRTLPMRVLGQVGDTYIILNSSEGLIIVDQHAAHERIRYERFLHEIRDNKMQKLLEPIVMNLSLEEYEKALSIIEKIRKLGFDMEDFGHRSIIIRGIPPMLTRKDAEESIREIIALGPKALEEKWDDIIKLISCKGAIKANQRLSIFEMEQLINQLLRCENPYTCPHGRPTMIKLTLKDLEKMFKRKE